MRTTPPLIAAALLLAVAAAAPADTIILKNGTTFKGAVLKEDKNEVEAVVDAGLIRLRRADIAAIKKGSIWENSPYLKKAHDFSPAPAAKEKKTVVKEMERRISPAQVEAEMDSRWREKEMDLRRQELELKRVELELQREELKLKQRAFEQGERVEFEPAETAAEVEAAPPRRPAASPAVEKEEFAEEALPAAPVAEELPLKKSLSEEEARQIAIEEQQKEQERKDRLESQRRLQEIRQKQEGVTIRGKVRPAGSESYDTY